MTCTAPILGPDGFFYWCKGAFAPSKQHELSNGRTLRIKHAAHIYRARPDGSQLEMVITGRNEQSRWSGIQSNRGERFLSGTFFDLSKPGQTGRHSARGVRRNCTAGKNPRVLTPHPNTGGFLPILAQLGPAAPSGVAMPRHQAMRSRLQSLILYLTEFNTRIACRRHRLEPNPDRPIVAVTTTLLESDQTDFHPTDVIEDADGSLLVADTGSWYMICCPTSKIAKPDVLGAIYRMQKRGSASVADPRGLQLDWNQPDVDWLADSRPAVVKRAIDALAHSKNIKALRRCRARTAAVWSLHRIPGPAARSAVREFLNVTDPRVCAAAIHSAALWRDPDASEPLIKLLSQDDPQLRRLSAMALGRLGDRDAIKPLLDSWSPSSDPFLRHALVYALFEIGSVRDLPTGHPLGKQVRLMRETQSSTVTTGSYPDIQPADAGQPNPNQLAQQKQRLEELAAYLPHGDAQRGAKLFNDQDRSKCTTCHLKDQKGVRLGPDLTWIGAIRSERDLLEAIVFPSASIARYHEVVNVLTTDGRTISGLLVKESLDQMFLSSAAGIVQAVSFHEIEQARYASVSLMPDGLDKLLKPGEIADLVAYLKSAQPPAKD